MNSLRHRWRPLDGTSALVSLAAGMALAQMFGTAALHGADADGTWKVPPGARAVAQPPVAAGVGIGITKPRAAILAPAGKSAADPKPLLSDATEKQLAQFAAKAAVFRRKDYDAHMKELVSEVIETTGSPEAARSLEEAGKKAVEQTMGNWPEKLADNLRKYLDMARIEGPRLLERWPAEMIAKNTPVEGVQPPEEQPQWNEGLKHALTPAKFTLWKEKVDAENRQQDNLIAEYMKPLAEQFQERAVASIKTEISDLASVLHLPPERVHLLDDAGREAVKEATAAWEKPMSEQLRAMEGGQQRLVISRGEAAGVYLDQSEKTHPANQESWKRSLKEILSTDEQNHWRLSQDERLKRRAHALAMIMVLQTERQLLFTASQRSQVEAAFEKITPEAEAQIDTGGENWAFPAAILRSAVSKANPDDIKAILDAAQWRHWQESGHKAVFQELAEGDEAQAGPEDADKTDKSEVADMDTVLSGFLYQRYRQERSRRLAEIQLSVEDVNRVVSLPPQSVERLQTAAKGAVEHSLQSWRASYEGWVRGSIKGATVQDIRRRLASFSNMSIGQQDSTQDSAYWRESIDEVLSDAQREAWKQETDARTAYQERAISAWSLAELDRRRHLTAPQYARLQPLMDKAVAEYLPDLTRFFSYDWQLQSYYVLLPVRGIPEDEIKSILTPQQWELLNDQDLTKHGDYWTSIQQYHDQRVKNEGHQGRN